MGEVDRVDHDRDGADQPPPIGGRSDFAAQQVNL